MSTRASRQQPVPLSPAPPRPPAGRDEPRSLRSYLDVVRRHAWILVATVLAVTAAVFLISQFVLTKEYRGTATLRVLSRSALSAQTVSADDIQYLDRLGNTYARLAKSRPLALALQQQLQLKSLPNVSVSIPTNTELLKLSVTTRDPQLSAKAANLLSTLLIDRLSAFDQQGLAASDADFRSRLSQLEHEIATEKREINQLQQRAELSADDQDRLLALQEDVRIKRASAITQRSQYEAARLVRQQRANTLEMAVPADPPTSASSPRLKLNLALGVFFGLLAGLAFVFVRDTLGTRVKSRSDVETTTGIPVLAEIPSMTFTQQRALFERHSRTDEAFRRLRATLFAHESQQPLQTLLVTSAEPGEGKSTIVANLAYSMALGGQNVLLIDADLRAPVQHKSFRLENNLGLTDVLGGATPVERAVQKSGLANLSVLTAGRSVNDPGELLRRRMPMLMTKLRQSFDVILIDSPALLPVIDGLTIAPIVDGVVVVAGHGQTRRAALEALANDLETFRVRPLGVIVNRAETAPSYHYYG